MRSGPRTRRRGSPPVSSSVGPRPWLITAIGTRIAPQAELVEAGGTSRWPSWRPGPSRSMRGGDAERRAQGSGSLSSDGQAPIIWQTGAGLSTRRTREGSHGAGRTGRCCRRATWGMPWRRCCWRRRLARDHLPRRWQRAHPGARRGGRGSRRSRNDAALLAEADLRAVDPGAGAGAGRCRAASPARRAAAGRAGAALRRLQRHSTRDRTPRRVRPSRPRAGASSMPGSSGRRPCLRSAARASMPSARRGEEFARARRVRPRHSGAAASARATPRRSRCATRR